MRSAAHAPKGLSGREAQIVAHLHRNGASFFGPLHEAAGGGFPQETVDAIWDLVWKGLLTNDTLHALRAYSSPPERTRRPGKGTTFRSRRLIPPSAEGRWTLVPSPSASTNGVGDGDGESAAGAPRRRHARCRRRSSNCPADSRRCIRCCGGSRRPAASGAATSSPASAPRSSRSRAPSICCATCATNRDEIVTVTLSATDPANPYGVLIPWPLRLDEAGDRLIRQAPLAQGRRRRTRRRARRASSTAAPPRGSAAAIGS